MNGAQKVNLDPSNYAGFWRRFLSVCIDAIYLIPIFMGISHLVMMVLTHVYGDIAHVPRNIAQWVPEAINTIIALYIYAWFFAWRWQGTLGMYVLKFHICDTDGNRISQARGWWWGITSLIGVAFCLAGVIYLMTKFDVNAVSDISLSCLQQNVAPEDCIPEIEAVTGVPYDNYMKLSYSASAMAFFLLFIWALSIALPKDKTGFHNLICGTRFLKGRPPASGHEPMPGAV